jgi:uncharacterized protein (DUF58 family)
LLTLRARVTPRSGAAGELLVEMPGAVATGGLVRVVPEKVFVNVGAEPQDVIAELHPERRGRYRIRGARVRRTDPLRLMTTLPITTTEESLLVYPRFWRLDHFDVPVGRSYQPGGIPLASSTGDAIEFVGTRDYREGDPIKNIHWRSWARRGKPVVKEYQEEYFSRVALILDTFLKPGSPRRIGWALKRRCPRSPRWLIGSAAGKRWCWPARSVRSQHRRSLGYLENILDVLSCLEPCAIRPSPPGAFFSTNLRDSPASWS